MCDEDTKKRFRVTDGLIGIVGILVIGIGGWNANKTIALLNMQNKIDMRLVIVERQYLLNNSFTKQNGAEMARAFKKDNDHLREMMENHIGRTEPILNEIYRFMLKNDHVTDHIP